ncbi:MAG TPA: tail fiber domain-containing protein [Pyrinomonadaceae bacterium]|nr:tail fiber domain-containing protein [Pyrinomonadaceae bacterium]
MKNLRSVHAIVRVLLVVACFHMLVLAQVSDDKNKGVTISGSGLDVKWDVAVPHSELTLTISGPDGQVFRKEFKGRSAEFTLADSKGERFADGQYSYELRVTPQIPSDVREKLAAARAKGNDEAVRRDLIKRGALSSQPLVVSGGFAILNGSVIVDGALEEGGSASLTQPRVSRPINGSAASNFRPNTAAAMSGFRRHHPVVNPFFDFVIADDLIVQGSACVGLDCVDGENFGFDTIRMKENNTRLQYDDTSTSAGFPTNNWQIRANSSASGGGSFLAFVDQGATGNSETGTIVFEVDAGAPANSLRVSSGGNVGIGTATPVLDVHVNTTDTPAFRLEQNNSGGFTAQTWDIGANEANFFVRDVTSGSRLSFRIRPGAPTSSLDIAANGNVGVGTASPNARVDLKQLEDTFVGSLHLRRATTNDTWAVATGIDNNLYFGYATDASLANAAADFTVNPLVLTASNRVGIGTNAPDQKLSVNGDASKTGGNTWLAFSDERLKNIRGPFNSGLNAVMKLQPLRYEYRPNNALGITPNGEHIGFTAQAVQKVIPEAVTANADGYLMVNGDPIIWTMLNAIKEQQQQILELKREVRRLRATTRRRR